MSNGRIYFRWSENSQSKVEYRFNFNNKVINECSYVNFIDDYIEIIPKNLIFVWIGKEFPKWVEFSMSQFKNVNPSYNIIFKHIVDWDSSTDGDVVNLKECFNNKNSFWKLYYDRPFIQNLVNSKNQVNKCVAMSDIFRFYLLNEYGGIYLDTDTFPNKPFDDDLLKRNFFVGYTTLMGQEWEDIYFLGMKQGTISDEDYISEHYSLGDFDIYKIFKSPYFNYNKVHNFNGEFLPEWEELKRDFYSRELEFKPNRFDRTSYIAHFNTCSWNKNINLG